MQEKENVLRIFKETKVAWAKGDSVQLKNLSNQTTHTASITQDPDNIIVAVIVYTLSKIIERKEHYQSKPGWEKFYRGISDEIAHSIDAIQKHDEAHLRKHIQGIRKRIEGMSNKLKGYVKDIFVKASVNKASRLYEHGISMEKTAELLGVTMYDLAGYTGQTGIADVSLGKTYSTKERIKTAMGMFK